MPTRKLLLADDSVTTQRVIELTFSHEDVQVITAGDGEEAITRIRQERPDIVLADIGMPKRSGYDVAAFVKGNPDFAHIPVLLLAGAFEPVDDAKANQVGSNGVLVKPFEPQHVIARVRELIGGAQGDPMSSATADIPRPVTRLASPKPVELPRRETPQPIAIDTDIEFAATPAAPAIDAPAGGDSLDDYFDRLDAAFADLDGPPPFREGRRAATPPPPAAPAPAPRSEGPVLEHDLDFIDARPAAHASPIDAPIDLPLDAPVAGGDSLESIGEPGSESESGEIPTLEELLGEVGDKAKLDDEPFSIDDAMDAGPAEPAPPAPSVRPAQPAQAIQPTPPTPPQAPAARPAASIADAFSALLAVEQGEANSPVRLVGAAPEPAVTEELIEKVTERVLQRLQEQGNGTLQDAVARIVSETAERLVREEIQRIRNK